MIELGFYYFSRATANRKPLANYAY